MRLFRIISWVLRKISLTPDPLRYCEKYKERGCLSVDIPDCDIRDCRLLEGYYVEKASAIINFGQSYNDLLYTLYLNKDTRKMKELVDFLEKIEDLREKVINEFSDDND